MTEKESWKHLIEVEDLGGLKKKIKISYTKEGVDMAVEKACQKVGKNATVKGFRKGKAPVKLIKSYYGKEVMSLAKNLLAVEGLMHAQYENKITPIDEPVYDVLEIKPDGTFLAEVQLSVEPELNVQGYLGLEVEIPPVSKENIRKTYIMNLRNQYPKRTPKDVVESGDEVAVDYSVRHKKVEVENIKSHVVVVNENMPEPLGKNLIGLKEGEEVATQFEVPEGHQQFGGSTLDMDIKIVHINGLSDQSDEEIADELDMELDALNEQINSYIDDQYNKEIKSYIEESLVDKLIEMHSFDIPEEWVDRENAYLSAQFGAISNDELEQKLKQMAERNVRRAFIIEKIYEAHPEMKVSQDDINVLIQNEAESHGVSTAVVKKEIKDKNMYDDIVAHVRNQKVMKLLVENAVINQKSEKETAEVVEIPSNPFEQEE